MFERLENRYFFRGELILQNEMHIGSGKGDGTTDALVVKDFNGTPYIPGSSLRGVLRSTIERIVATLGYNPCLLINGNQCVTTSKCLQEEFKGILKEKDFTKMSSFLTNTSKVCPVCQLFGSTVVASRIRVTDLSLNGTSQVTSVRHGVAINRDTETAQGKAKFAFETVPKGSKFSFEIIGENLTEDNLALLAIGIQEMIDGNFWIGGNTARGLGKCKLENLEIKYFKEVDGLKGYLKNKTLNSLSEEEFFAKAASLLSIGG